LNALIGILLWLLPKNRPQNTFRPVRTNPPTILSATVAPPLRKSQTTVTLNAKGLGIPTEEILENPFIDVSDEMFMKIDGANRSLKQAKFYRFNGEEVSDFEEMKAYMRTFVDPPKNSKPWYHTGVKALSTLGLVKPFIIRSASRNLFHAFFSRQVGVKSTESRSFRRIYQRQARKMVKKLITGIRGYWSTHPMITEDEYIASLPTSKQAIYRLGLLRWDETHRINTTVQMCQKSGEPHYDHANKIRGRIFGNPDCVFKALTGPFNKNMIDAAKSVFPQFIHGMDCGQLEDKLTQMLRAVEDGVTADADGSSHDAHEHYWKIESIDIPLNRALVYEYSARQGFDVGKANALAECLFHVFYPFIIYYVGTRTLMMKGILFGSVLSGVSQLTTLGNTLRGICMQLVIQHCAGLRDSDCQFAQSGDDQFRVVNRSKMEDYNFFANRFYVETEKRGGIGYLVKFQMWRGDLIDFLSKTGGIICDTIVVHRKFHRAIIGGNVTHKLKKNFTSKHHRWAIASQLASWVGDLPLLSDYLEYRRTHLPMLIPESRDILWNDPERFYKMVAHNNPHAEPGHYEGLRHRLYSTPFSFLPSYENSVMFYDHLEMISYN